MPDTYTKGESHGCIVCGKLYQLYVVYHAGDEFVGCKVMSAGGRHVPHPQRALVACERHTEAEVEAAVQRVYGEQRDEEE